MSKNEPESPLDPLTISAVPQKRSREAFGAAAAANPVDSATRKRSKVGSSKSKRKRGRTLSRSTPAFKHSRTEDELAVSTSNKMNLSSFQDHISAISVYTKKMTADKVDFGQRIAAHGAWVNDLLIGDDSTLYFRTTVCRLVIPMQQLAAATSTTEFAFTKEGYAAEWQLYTLASGWNGSAGKLVPYVAISSKGDFMADQIEIWYEDILHSICRIEVLSTALNPGGFGEANIVVRNGLSEASLSSLKTAVATRFPDSKGNITYITVEEPEPSGHTLVFQNVWSNFEIWQKGSPSAALDDFKERSGCHLSQQSRLPSNEQMDSISSSQSLCTLSNKPPVKTANQVMGCTAQKYADESVQGSGPARNKYEWLHRMAPGLVIGADRATNIVCATVEAKAWMHVYALIARICLQNRRDPSFSVSIGTFCNRKYDYCPNAPPFLSCTVNLSSQVIAAVTDFKIRQVLQPSKWINAVVMSATEEHMVDLSAGVERDPPVSHSRSVDQVNSPFVTFAGSSDGPPAPLGDLRKFARKFADDVGLLEIENCKYMDQKESVKFYNALVKSDPDAANLFPNPAAGPVPEGVHILKGKAKVQRISGKKPESIVIRTYVQMLPPGSNPAYWHTTAIYPNSGDLFDGKLNADDTLRMTLLKDAVHTSYLRVAGGLKIAKLYQYIPDLQDALSPHHGPFHDYRLDCVAPVAKQHTFQPFRLSFPTVMDGFVDFGSEGLSIADDHLVLKNIRFSPQVLPVLDFGTKSSSKRESKREFFASFSADVVVQLNPRARKKETFTLCVSGAKLRHSAYMQGELTNWINPFGLKGFRVDSGTVFITFEPTFSISSKMIFVVDANLTIVLQGDWSQESGVALLGTVTAPLNMDSILAVHQEVTAAESRLRAHPSTPTFQLEHVDVSLCSQDHTFDSGTYPEGMQVHGNCTIDDCGVDMTISVSALNGLKFSGAVTNFKVGSFLTIAKAELDFEINPQFPKKNYMQASTDFEVLSHQVLLLCRFGTPNCALAIMNDIEFHLSDISKYLGWMDFDFPKLQFSTATDKMKVELNGSQFNLPKGQALSGVAHFQLIDILLGHKCFMSFQYSITNKNFVLVPGQDGAPPTLTSGRLAPPEGLRFQIDMKSYQFVMEFGTSFKLLGNKINLSSGFRIGGPSGSDAITVHFYASLHDEEGFSLTLGPIKTLPIYDFAIDADVSAGGSFGTLAVYGSFKVGSKGKASLGFSVSENPEHDAFMAEVVDATLSDIVEFTLESLGLDLPPIPLLEDIVIKKLKMVYTPDGMQIAEHVYPPGCCFDADIVINIFGTHEVAAYVEVGPTHFEIKATMSPFDIFGLISVSSSDGKSGALFHMKADKKDAIVNIDCKVKFLFKTVATVIHIKPPSVFDFMFRYNILPGIGAEFNVVSEEDKFLISFQFGQSAKQKAVEETIALVMKKAEQMQEDADIIANRAAEAEQTYNEGLAQLKANLEEAQASFDAYCDTLHQDLDDEKDDWETAMDEAKSDAERIKEDLKNNRDQLAADYDIAISDARRNTTVLERDIKQLGEDLEALRKDFETRISSSEKQFDEAINTATAEFNEAKLAQEDAQDCLDEIKKNEPHGRSCSSKKKAQWQHEVNLAQSELNTCADALDSATTFLENEKTTKHDSMEELKRIAKEEQDAMELDIQNQQSTLEDLERQLDEIDNNPIDFKRLGELQSKKRWIENAEATAIKFLKQQVATHPDTIALKKAKADVASSSKLLHAIEDSMKPKNDQVVDSAELDVARKNIMSNIDVLLSDSAFAPAGSAGTPSKWTAISEVVWTAVGRLVTTLEIKASQKIGSMAMPPRLMENLQWLKHAMSTEEKVGYRKCVECLETIEVYNQTLLEFDAVFERVTRLINDLINPVKPYLDDDLKTLLDIEAVKTAGASDISLPGGQPFFRRLQALKAMGGFVNSAKAILQAAASIIKTFSAEACSKAQQAIQSISEKELLGHANNPTPCSGTVLTKLNEFIKDVAIEMAGARENVTTHSECIAKLQDPATSAKIAKAVERVRAFYRSGATKEYSVVKNALSSICQEYYYGAIVVKKDPLAYAGVLEKAQAAFAAANAAMTAAQHRVEQIEADTERKIAKLRQRDALKLILIEDEIAGIVEQVKGNLVELFMKMQAAYHECEHYMAETEQHLNEMQNAIDAGIGEMCQVKSNEDVDQSPAGKHLQESKDAVSDWETGDLHSKVVAASQSAQKAADNAMKAAEIYKYVMERDDVLSIGSIEGSAEWVPGDITFKFKVIFHVKINIDCGLFKLHINIGPWEMFDLKFSLSQIYKIFDNIFAFMWEEIKSIF